MRWFFFLTGTVILRVRETSQTEFFELCRTLELTPKALKRVKKTGDITCRFTRSAARELLARAKECALDVEPLENRGLPALWHRFIRRPGLVIGTVLAVALLILSRLFLWEVSLVGCEEPLKEEILAELDGIGLGLGTFLPHVDTDEVELALRRADARVGYVSVNLVGTVAFVQVRQAEQKGDQAPLGPANLVAKKDGLVVLPMIFEGERLVEVGEYVRQGQLLASGIIDSENGASRITRAAGQVMARTEETVAVSVPLVYQEKAYTGQIFCEFEVQFFGLCGKLFKNTGKMTSPCDIIVNNRTFCAGARTLPVGTTLTRYHAYTYREARRTATEALQLARAELAARLALEGQTRHLLSTTVETVVDAHGVTLICRAVFEEDIGLVSEFSVTGEGP